MFAMHEQINRVFERRVNQAWNEFAPTMERAEAVHDADAIVNFALQIVKYAKRAEAMHRATVQLDAPIIVE